MPEAHAIPAHSSQLANEIKVTSDTIRVKLSDLGRVLTIKGTDLSLSLAQKPELGSVQADRWVVDCNRNLIYQPETGKSRAIPRTGVLIESLSGILSVNQRRFRDQLVVYPKSDLNPSCMVVNHLPIEKYLESVVNGEFNSKWAETAVEAQIIAARTYAVYQMKEVRRRSVSVFDVESTQKDQVYLGMDRADSKAAQLVERTKGMVMVSSDKKPIKAFYHASCGGQTILPEQVWGGHFAGFHHAVTCPFCHGSPSFQWQHSLSLSQIEQKIRSGIQKDASNRGFWPDRFLKSPRSWTLSGVTATESEDHRAQDLVFAFTSKTGQALNVAMNAYQARNWLDPAKIKSTWFSLIQKGRSILFSGKGSGHGVGMCQWGAKRMGEKGYTREQILSYYYPGIKIAKAF